MPAIQNPDAGEAIRKQAGLTLAEGYPQQLASTVQPVMDMTPRFHRVAKTFGSSTTSTSGSGTVFTTSATKETMITSVQFGIIKDNTCDAANGSCGLRVNQGGAQQLLCVLPVLTTTGQEHNVTVSFPTPVRADKGTAIQFFNGSFTVGNFVRAYVVSFYEVEAM